MKNKNMPLPALVVQGNDCTELAIARGLGKYNIPVYILSKGDKRPLSSYSKYITDTIYMPDPLLDKQGFLSSLENIGRQFLERYKRRILIFPTDDGILLILGENYSLLKKYFVILGDVKDEDILKLSRKSYLFKTLQDKGYKEYLPKTFSCYKKEDIEALRDNVPFPCIIKPCEKDISLTFYNRYKSKVMVVRNKQELEQNLLELLDKDYKLLVQEMVNIQPGKEYCWWGYRSKRGEIFGITTQEVRKFPTIGGTATFEVLEDIPIIHQYVHQILEAINFWGMCEISFMEDNNKDKKYKLLEINYRCWFQILLAIELGYNFPYIAYKEVYEDIIIRPVINEKAKKCWMNMEHDFIKSIIVEKKYNIIKRIIRWIPQVFIGSVHGIFSLSDIKVSFVWIGQMAMRVSRNIFRLKEIIQQRKDGINLF